MSVNDDAKSLGHRVQQLCGSRLQIDKQHNLWASCALDNLHTGQHGASGQRGKGKITWGDSTPTEAAINQVRIPQYGVDMVCTNCGFKGRMMFPRGKKVPRRGTRCPNCECDAMVKNILANSTEFPCSKGS